MSFEVFFGFKATSSNFDVTRDVVQADGSVIKAITNIQYETFITPCGMNFFLCIMYVLCELSYFYCKVLCGCNGIGEYFTCLFKQQ